MKYLMIGILLITSGCSTVREWTNDSPSHAAQSAPTQVEPRKLDAVETILSKKIAMDCDTSGTFEDHCGLITVNSKKEYKQYRKDFCQTKEKKKSCKEEFDKMIGARMALRYSYADFQKIILMVRADPKKYSEPLSVEKELLESHNEGVEATADKQREYEIRLAYQQQAEREQEEENENARRLQAFQMMNQYRNAVPQNTFTPITPYQMQPSQSIDYACVSRCTASGSLYSFCQSKCSY
jgi:hypothetical protein